LVLRGNVKVPLVAGKIGILDVLICPAPEALSVKLSHVWSHATPIFDDENTVSVAGLVPVMALAERAGLSELVAAKVDLGSTWSRPLG
jgi:hypothetical protein